MTNRYHNLEAFHRTVADMIADPEITGDLLLIGIWLARASILQEPPSGTGKWGYRTVAADLYGADDSRGEHIERVKRALRKDVPHYDWRRDVGVNWRPAGGHGCAGDTADGLCGLPHVHETLLTDLQTGRSYVVAACAQHVGWLNLQVLRNQETLAGLGDRAPNPPANAGGALARHLPGYRWPQWWARLDPGSRPNPGPVSPPAPQLRVLTFDPPDDDESIHHTGVVPQLTVLDGGAGR